MSELTKEWLHQTIAELEEERDATPGAVNEDAAMALAAMKLALASLESEPGVNHQPVAWQYKEYVHVRGLGYLWREKLDCEFPGADCETLQDVVPLYIAPPAPVSVPECFARFHEVIKNRHYGRMPEEVQSAFDECAAMLQGAKLVSNRDELPDGWVACSERMPEAGDDMIVFTDDIVMSGISYSKKKGFYIQALAYDDDEPVDNVTHWMPLPAAPQQEV